MLVYWFELTNYPYPRNHSPHYRDKQSNSIILMVIIIITTTTIITVSLCFRHLCHRTCTMLWTRPKAARTLLGDVGHRFDGLWAINLTMAYTMQSFSEQARTYPKHLNPHLLIQKHITYTIIDPPGRLSLMGWLGPTGDDQVIIDCPWLSSDGKIDVSKVTTVLRCYKIQNRQFPSILDWTNERVLQKDQCSLFPWTTFTAGVCLVEADTSCQKIMGTARKAHGSLIQDRSPPWLVTLDEDRTPMFHSSG